MFEFFEHTADLGLRVRAATLDEVFRDAAEGLLAMIVEQVPSVPDAGRRELQLRNDRLDWLLFDWLTELLWIVEAEGLLLRDFDVHIDLQAGSLKAVVSCVPFDVERQLPLHEVKAITYHGLRVERTPDEWLAEVIVDI